MAKKSAGILVFRRAIALEVLLVHPGGPYWARKDLGAWSIPKGEIQPGEDPLAAACREFEEEVGFRLSGTFEPLTPVRQQGGKLVAAWAIEGDVDTSAARSTTFRMEWPPGSGSMREFPEADRAEWFPIATARLKIISGQRPLLDELAAMVGETNPS